MLFETLASLLQLRSKLCRFGTVAKFGKSDKLRPMSDKSVSAEVSSGISSISVGALSSVIGALFRAARSLSSSSSVFAGVSEKTFFSASVCGIMFIR